MKKRGKRKRRGRSAAGRRALSAPAAGNVPVGLLIAHGAVGPDTGNTGGRRVRPTQAEKAHAARLFADPAEPAEELGHAP